MQPIPDLAPVPSPDPLVAQSRNDPRQGRTAGPGEPDARVPAETEARRGWSACAGHDGGGGGVGGGEAGLPRIGKPRGNPNLAPRCGAKTRAGLGCRAPAMGNGRCPAGQARGQAPHGGCSTGPRTPEGLARLAAARTTHGRHGAAKRVLRRHHRTVITRARVFTDADELGRYLSPDLVARLDRGPPELASPIYPANVPSAPVADKTPCNVGRDARGRFAAGPRRVVAGCVVRGRVVRGRAAEREMARAEAAALAPWKAGIAQARLAKRLVLAGRRAARIAKRRNDPMQGRATCGGPAIGAVAQGPHATANGAGTDAARWAAQGAAGRAAMEPAGRGAATGGGAAIGAVAQGPHATSDGAGADVAVRAGQGAGGGARMAPARARCRDGRRGGNRRRRATTPC